MVVKFFSGIWRYGTSGNTEPPLVIPILEKAIGPVKISWWPEISTSPTPMNEPEVGRAWTTPGLRYRYAGYSRGNRLSLGRPQRPLSLEAAREGITGEQHSSWIGERIDLPSVLRDVSKHWDGGYALAGIIGNGDAFAMRDPLGIRPGFYFADDEVIAVASERAPHDRL